MKRGRLGQSELEISKVVYGSMGRRPASESDRARLLDATLDCGITSIDTAPLYDFGEVEASLGRLLRGRRDRFELLSKVGLRWEDAQGELFFDFTDSHGQPRSVRRDSRPESIRRDVEGSLQRLGTDRLDLCQIHQPDRQVPIEDSLGELDRLATEGKIRFFGVSNFDPRELSEALAALESIGSKHVITSNQVHFSLLEQTPRRDAVAASEAATATSQAGNPLEGRPGLLAYSPLEYGALSAAMLRPNGVDFEARQRGPHFQPANAKAIRRALAEVVVPLAEQHGATPSQIALAWLLHEPGVGGVIAGASSLEQIRENAQAVEIELSPKERDTLAARFASLRLDPMAGRGLRDRARVLARRVRGKLARLRGPS